MRPQPGNALQERRVRKKGDSDTDLRGQISVLFLLLLLLRVLARGKKEDSDTDLRGEISVLSSSSSLLRLRVLARGGPGGSGPWGSWGLARGGSRVEGSEKIRRAPRGESVRRE